MSVKTSTSLPKMAVQGAQNQPVQLHRSEEAKAADAIVSASTFERAKAKAGNFLSERLARYSSQK